MEEQTVEEKKEEQTMEEKKKEEQTSALFYVSHPVFVCVFVRACAHAAARVI